MSEPLTVESLLVGQIADLKAILATEQARIAELEADRLLWEEERRYLVDSLMELTGAAKAMRKPGEPEKPVEETVAAQTGPRRLSWHQATTMMNQRSAVARQEHLKALAEIARKRAG